MPNSPQPAKSVNLPPVGSLISEAWERTKKRWPKLLLIGLMVLGIEILLVVVLGIVAMILGVSGGLTSLVNGGGAAAAGMGLLFGILMLIWLILAIAVAMAGTVATYLVFDRAHDEKLSVRALLLEAKPLILPMILVSIPVTLLVIGGVFFFLIPGLVMAIFLMFSVFAVGLEGQSPLAAIRRSASMVSQAFWSVLGRWLVLIGINFAVGIAFAFASGFFPESLSSLLGLIQIVVNFLLGAFGTAYTVLFYRQLRTATNPDKPYSLLWMVIVSVLGWLIAGWFMMAVLPTVSSMLNPSNFNNMMPSNSNELMLEDRNSLEYFSDPELNSMIDGSESPTPEEMIQQYLEEN